MSDEVEVYGTALKDLIWVDVVTSGSTILECSGLMPLLKHKVVGWERELGGIVLYGL